MTTPAVPCRTDPGPWFSPDPAERSYAARQCHPCPLLLDCMRQALAAGEQHGVWGGVDFEARARGCGTERGYRAHRRRSEQPCDPCQAAYDEALETNRRRILADAHAAGGTARGYWTHRALEEEACVPCRRACARQSKERRDRARQGRSRPRTGAGAPRLTEALPDAPAGAQSLTIAS
ncbi:WhiB family transcriptional regulator [Streptomyces sp. NPDC058299]|uniref:WhiB family transcriptional regulator n=1 Tax=unclassified Streptomyces TaxID=2593676 RepID=UPI0036E22571